MARRTPLDAVVLVRELREKDARQGLHSALIDVANRTQRMRNLDEQVDVAVSTQADVQPVGEFLAQRWLLSSLGQGLSQAKRDREVAETVAVVAREQWKSDQLRLRAVEDLRDRRLARAREERNRLEARDLDEVAIQMWTRKERRA